jgi:hypothetical protein
MVFGIIPEMPFGFIPDSLFGFAGISNYADFQAWLTANPDFGDLIKGGGGIRKIRVRVGSRGQHGGARVDLLLDWAVRKDVILLLCFMPTLRMCRLI